MPLHAAWERHELKYSPSSTDEHGAVVGSLVLLHDQARPKSSEANKSPALSATAIDEPFAAMQPVSAVQIGENCQPPGKLAPTPPAGPAWEEINDRLHRAAES